MSQYRQKLNPRTGQFNLVPTAEAIAFKESVANFAALPATGNTINDGRITNDTGHLYIWSGTAWVDQGDFIDFTWDAISGKPTSTPAAIDAMVTTGTPRLTANTTYYVNCDTGNDNNLGTISSPFATIQKAVNMFPKNLGGFTATIKLFPSLNYAGNTFITNFYGGDFRIFRETSLGDSDVLITGSQPISIYNFTGYLDIDGSAWPPSSKKIILKTNVNYGTCLLIVDSSRILLNAAIAFADNGNTGTKGIDSRFSVVDINTITDYDSNKVATGIRNYGGETVWIENPSLSFGDTFLSPSNSGITIKGTGNYIIDSNFDLAVTRQHLQGTDQGLDTGGANASTAADVKDAVTKKHTQNTDTSIGTSSSLILDQNYPGTENSADPLDGGYVLAQPLVAGLSGELQKITLKLYKVGVPSGDFTVELRNTELDGTPGTNVLATKAKTAAEIPDTSATVDFIFSVPYSVVATTRYAIVTYGAGMSAGNYYVVVDENPGTFDIGFYWALGAQPWTWGIQNTTMYFKTYVLQSGTASTDVEIRDAVDKKHLNTLDHAQNTDTQLDNGIVKVDDISEGVHYSGTENVHIGEIGRPGHLEIYSSPTWTCEGLIVASPGAITAKFKGTGTASGLALEADGTQIGVLNVYKGWGLTIYNSVVGDKIWIGNGNALPSRIYLTSDDLSIGGWVDGNATVRVFVKSNGNVGIGTDNPQEALDVVGNAKISGEISIKVYSQNTEPTLGADNRLAMWIDTSDNYRVYLLFKRPSMSGYDDQVKVELI